MVKFKKGVPHSIQRYFLIRVYMYQNAWRNFLWEFKRIGLFFFFFFSFLHTFGPFFFFFFLTYLCSNQVVLIFSQIEPLTGPMDGGTRLTIHGKNLGKELSDILGGVTVAGVTCNLDNSAYEPPNKWVRVHYNLFITGFVTTRFWI